MLGAISTEHAMQTLHGCLDDTGLIPDGVREEAQTPSQTSLLPQTQSSNCTFKCNRNGPIPEVKLTEGHFSSLKWV